MCENCRQDEEARIRIDGLLDNRPSFRLSYDGEEADLWFS
jgi:hypothetical protein